MHGIKMKQLSLSIASLAFASISGLTAADSAQELGIAVQYKNDTGIEKDQNVLFATGFENGIEKPLITKRKGVSVTQDENIVFHGKSSAQLTATKNVDEGGDIVYKWKKGVNECYMRVYMRFDKDTIMPHHFIGLSGHTPTYKYRWGGSAGMKPPGGKDGKFGTTLEPPKGKNGRWKFYTYWHEMHSWQTPHGAADGRPNAYYGNNFVTDEDIALKRDEWFCVEVMIKMNDIGKHNGEHAFWIDGRKIAHWKPGSPEGTWMRDKFRTIGKWNKNPKPFEGFSWRTDESLNINKAYLQWYLSKDQSWPKMTAEKNTIYFDNLVVATSYIGPMAQAK